jgi:tetratricopeptide (TPR) repeat protein
MAEAYFELGDYEAGDQVFIEWLRDDPGNGMGHNGWANCYRGTMDAIHYAKSEEILLSAYAMAELRDKHYVVEGLINLYGDMGKPEKTKEYSDLYKRLWPTRASRIFPAEKTAPVRVEKVGRNEPCPCGSGKKYKKCCGA